MNRILDVYLHQDLAGKLIQNSIGKLSFAYDPTYLESEKPGISLSLPPQKNPFDGPRVAAFFSGLLPDDTVRHRLAKQIGVSEKNPFALLKIIGGECAGALSLYPEGQKPLPPTDTDIEILEDEDLKTILERLKQRPLLAGEDGIRLSLAGAQDKLAVGVHHNKITLIRGTSPTTHILKPQIQDIQDSVHNELFCMRLAKAVGLDVPNAELRYADGTPYFLVHRYDRIQDKTGTVRRIHQEDFCQALGIMPDLKYEREGGPNLDKCLLVLEQHSCRPAVDQLHFLDRVIFNYLIGNADAHGKNYSLLYINKKPQLAPAYDLLSTAVYPQLSAKMAMSIGKRYHPEEVLLRHWHRLVPNTAAAHKNLDKHLFKLATLCFEKANKLKTNLESEDITSPIFDSICTVIETRKNRLMRSLDR